VEAWSSRPCMLVPSRVAYRLCRGRSNTCMTRTMQECHQRQRLKGVWVTHILPGDDGKHGAEPGNALVGDMS
jgi:hypothetical protein